MRIIARGTIRRFCDEHSRGPEARTPLGVWYSTVARADWATPADVRTTYADAGILKGRRVVFNVGGNRFRVVVHVNYAYRVVYIRFVGTHEEYDSIDAESI